MTRPRVLVMAMGCLALLLGIVSVAASVVSDWSWPEYVESYTLTNAVVGLALSGSGAMIAWFRPANAVGWLLIAGGLGHLLSAAAAPIGAIGLAAEWPEPVTRALVTAFLVSWTIGLPALFFFALLLFPDGHLPSPRWRWLAWFIVVSTVWTVVTTAVAPSAPVPGEPGAVSVFAIAGAPVAAFEIGSAVVSLVVVPCVVGSLIVRYVRGDERTRRQLLWLILAVLAMFALNLQRYITGDGPILLLLSAALLPIAIAIAIIRYRLLDIRLVLSRTLVYGILIAVVVALYAGLVAALTAVVPVDADRAVSVAAAVVVALAFNPLRLLLQRALARTLFGSRDDPAATARRVGERVDGANDLSAVLAALRSSLRLSRVAVADAEGRILAADGPDGDMPTVALPLSSGDAGTGDTLIVALRPGERRLHDADRRSLALVMPLIALVLREQSLVAALRAARAQTAEARERERQVLHRDLHDGLGPVLTSATLRIDAARNTLDDDVERSRTALARARAEVGEALTELRRVVYGLRPIALDERGLVGALREQAAHPAALAVEVTADESLPQLSPAVELAAYRVAVEGIANANRHSTGSSVTVALSARDDVLEVMVRDDGTPPPAFQAGVGLRSLIDRVEELGGTVSAGPEGPSRHGWAVEARLPLRA